MHVLLPRETELVRKSCDFVNPFNLTSPLSSMYIIMPTDTQAIHDLSKEIAELTDEFENTSKEDMIIKRQILLAAEKLAIATREPDENVYHVATQVCV